MSTNRHIDAICAVVTVLTVLLAILFMNGAALGIEPITDEDAGTGQFTANDLDGAWDASDAARIDLTDGTITGNGAYIVDGDVHIVYAGKYVLTGTLAGGSVIVEADGDDKIWLLLDGADIRCEDSAALLVEQAEKVFLTLADGTENVLSSGPAYGQDAVSASIDGAVYSKDDLTINGSGSLTVAGEYQHGIVCNDDLVIAGGTVAVTAAQDGLHANDSTRIANADLTITAGDDGVTVSNDENTGYFYMESGSITIPSCYEGVEAVNVTIDGGTIDITSTDDGINANGTGSVRPIVTVNGGDVRIVNTQGMDADGMDSNGNIYINGGRVFVSMNGTGTNNAIDYGSENGGVCQVNGGTLVACGGSGMVESLDTASVQGFVETAASGAAGTNLTLADESRNMLLNETIPNAFTYVMLSAPGMTSGSAYTLSVGGTETQVTANDTSGASGGFGGMGGMFGGGMGGMFGGRGAFPGQNEEPASDQMPETSQAAPAADENEAEMPENGGAPATPDAQAAPQSDTQPQQLLQEPDDQPSMAFDPGDQAVGAFDRPNDGSAELPEQPEAFNGWDGSMMHGREQVMQQMQQDEAPVTGSQAAISSGSLILLGISALVLLAGILVAAKFKH